jgi:hypothetical protein
MKILARVGGGLETLTFGVMSPPVIQHRLASELHFLLPLMYQRISHRPKFPDLNRWHYELERHRNEDSTPIMAGIRGEGGFGGLSRPLGRSQGRRSDSERQVPRALGPRTPLVIHA